MDGDESRQFSSVKWRFFVTCYESVMVRGAGCRSYVNGLESLMAEHVLVVEAMSEYLGGGDI